MFLNIYQQCFKKLISSLKIQNLKFKFEIKLKLNVFKDFSTMFQRVNFLFKLLNLKLKFQNKLKLNVFKDFQQCFKKFISSSKF